MPAGQSSALFLVKDEITTYGDVVSLRARNQQERDSKQRQADGRTVRDEAAYCVAGEEGHRRSRKTRHGGGDVCVGEPEMDRTTRL